MAHRLAATILALGLLGAAAAGCYSVDYPAQHLCKTNPTCPPGHTCSSAGICVLTGTKLDAGVDRALLDAPQDGPVDKKVGADKPWPGDADLPKLDVGTKDAGPKVLFFDDFNDTKLNPTKWDYWRVEHTEKNMRLETVDKPAGTFAYGHYAAGRGSVAFAKNGKNWKDYRLEAELEAKGPTSTWNPLNIGACYKSFSIYFRVQDATESWNVKGDTYYALGMHTATCLKHGVVLGDWVLSRYIDWYIPGTGWKDPTITPHQGDTERIHPDAGVAGTNHLKAGPNKIAIEVKGKNIKIEIWNGVAWMVIYDKPDLSPKALLTGGIGIGFGWEGMGWIDNVKVTEL